MKNLFYKRKAVVTSLLICTILILVSTSGPIMNGKHIQEIIYKNKEVRNIESKSSYNINTYEDIFLLIRSLLKENKNFALLRLFDRLDFNIRRYCSEELLNDFPIVFDKLMGYFISQNLNRRELMSVVYQEIIPIHNEIKYIINREKTNFDISKKFYTFLTDINFNYEYEDEDESQIQNEDPYGYWKQYSNVLKNFSRVNRNNFADWHSQIVWLFSGGGITRGLTFNLNVAAIFLALIVGLLSGDYTVSFVISSFAVAIDLLAFRYALNGYVTYDQVRSLEVSASIHIVDKSGQGINGLNGVFSSNDVKEWDIEKYDLTIENDFTYDLINVNKIDESGWYEIKVRSDENGRYYQAPPPPGSSNVTFLAQKTIGNFVYEKLSEEIPDILPGETFIGTFMIESNPNIPDPPSGPVCLQLNKKYTYTVVSKDPDGGQLKYQLDFDAEGIHNYNDYNDFNDSGVPVQISHVWNLTGTYVIKVRTLDDQKEESGWSKGLTVVVAP